MMTMLGVMLERHGRQLPVVNGIPAYTDQALPGNQSQSVQQRPVSGSFSQHNDHTS
jgi:hypothetical protein